MSLDNILKFKSGWSAILVDWHRLNLASLVALIASLFVAFSVARAVYRIWFHPLSKLPGPVVYCVFYLPFLYQDYIKGRWVYQTKQLHQKYGPIVRIGPNHIMVDGEIGWPQVYGRRKANQSEYEKLPAVHKANAHSIIDATRDIHRRQRRQLNHAFSDFSLTQQEHTIQRYIGMLLSRLQAHAEKSEAVDMVHWLNCTSFDIISDLTLSQSLSNLDSSVVHPWIKTMFDSVRNIMFRRFFAEFPLLRLILSMFSSKFGTDQHDVRNQVKDMVHQRMALGVEPGGRKDFMSYMMRKTKDGEIGMLQAEIFETTPTVIVAGSETTASALSGLWFYLDKHPRARDELTREIRAAFDSEEDITMQKAGNLEYLQACINEVLRIYPPAAETPARVSPGDFIEGIYIPPGTTVSVYQWATNRNPKHFADPDSFIPERWLPPSHPLYDERFRNDNHAVFKPFSYGSRDCIGKNLAINELRIIVSRFLYRFDYEVMEGQDDWHMKQSSFIIWGKGPLMVRLKKRHAVV